MELITGLASFTFVFAVTLCWKISFCIEPKLIGAYYFIYRLAIRNTELIKSYVALDDRIRILAITLKNWAAAKRLTGSGGHQISNYCLVLMLLHFLQRTCPPVIPVLQQAHESEPMLLEDARTTTTDKIFIDGWDCSFMSTAAEMSPNKESLGHYFHFRIT